MLKIIELNAVMRLYESNFRNLHWNSVGNEFNDAHKEITTEYYELLAGTIDQISEIMAMFGLKAPNYIEVLDILKESSLSYCIVDSNVVYTRADIIKFSDIMLGDICKLLADVLDDEQLEDTINAGIKSELENILYQFTLQYRYINKRRLGSAT